MTRERFDKLTDEMVCKIVKMRDTKGREYVHGDDRLENFKSIADSIGISPLQVWLVYFLKHIRAIESFVKHGKTFSSESIEGRFVDALTYLLLGYGLILDDTPGEYYEVCPECLGEEKYTSTGHKIIKCQNPWHVPLGK